MSHHTQSHLIVVFPFALIILPSERGFFFGAAVAE